MSNFQVAFPIFVCNSCATPMEIMDIIDTMDSFSSFLDTMDAVIDCGHLSACMECLRSLLFQRTPKVGGFL